jgi:hypothetical protein
MAALSTSTYGKATAMTSAELADRITAALELAYDALATLDGGVQTGAVADQGAINTLRKVVQDFGNIAGDARKAATDEAAQAADEKAKARGDAPAGSSTDPADGTSTGPGPQADSGPGNATSSSSSSSSSSGSSGSSKGGSGSGSSKS